MTTTTNQTTRLAADFSIAGKIVAVTGAAAGIGAALSAGLAAAGAEIVLLDRNVDGLKATAAALGSNAIAMACDISSEHSVREAAHRIRERHGHLDALVNNAGAYERGPIEDLDLEGWERVISVNLTGTFLMTRECLPLLTNGETSSVVNFASALGVRSHPGGGAYGAAKAAVMSLTNTLHQELANRGVRVNAVAPGLTNTALATANQSAEYIERIAGQYPGGRLGEPEDIVGLVQFLVSSASRHISGSTIFVRPVGG